MLDTTLLTIRHAIGALIRNPRFVVLATLMLALGIASTTTIYTLIKGVLLTPPPYEQPEDLVFVTGARADNRDEPAIFNWPEAMWTEWLADSESFEAIAGYRWAFNYLVSSDGSEALEGMMVSEGYFSVVGVEPQWGRSFIEADALGTENPAIILGYDLWVRRFGRDPDIIGRTVQLSRQPPTTVVGIMPPDVRFLPSPSVASEPNYDLHSKVDYWLPIPLQARQNAAWNVIARLNPDVTAGAAEAEVAVRLARQAETAPQLEGLGARIEPLMSVLNAEGKRLLLPLLAAAALVLLIACGNTTALLLIRGLQRQHEYGLRAAIGAGRRRLFGLVLSESLILAILSGALGFVMALGFVRLFTRASGDAIPQLDDVTIGWGVFAFGLGAALIACVVAGLVPALHAARLDPVDSLRSGGHKSSKAPAERRVLGTVVIGQTALTLALLVCAGLMIRTLYNLDVVQPGYDTRNLLTMSVTAVDGDWQDFHERALEQVSILPGVEGAAFAWGVPLTGNAWASRITIEGFTTPDASDSSVALPIRSVTSGYFDMLGQPVTVGREFRASDDQQAPQVAIVNEMFVERYLGGGNAIGKTIWPRGTDGPAVSIVGVIACVLTLGGVYSVLSLSVTARQREIAIRSAVGAERNRILGLVIGQGLKMIGIGALVGALVSVALSRLLQTWLYGVEPTDPLTLIGATALFLLISLVACWAPARRAATIEPVDALRTE